MARTPIPPIHRLLATPLLLLLVLLWCLPAPPPTTAAEGAGAPRPAPPRRVALVVGNGAYRSAPELPNPPNDA